MKPQRKKFPAQASLLSALLSVAPLGAAAQTIVDVHCHNVLPVQTEVLSAHGALLEEGFPLPAWNAEAHLQMMDEAGIGCALLSMPAPQPYFGDTAECQAVIRRYNEETAALCRTHPDRFRFCAALPLPDVEAAIGEAVFALDSLGADGVKLATNSRGLYLGDERLDPLMEVLDARRALVVLHPHKPVPVNDSLLRTAPLAVYEYPAETTRAVIAMIARNVPARYPHIRFVIPHAGSFLPLALTRMRHVQPIMERAGLMQPVDWEANLRNFYYDLAGGVTPDVLRSLLSITEPSHLLFGSDYPYTAAPAVRQALENVQSLLGTVPAGTSLFGKADAAAADEAPASASPATDSLLVRISEIEVYPEHLDEYLARARRVGEISVREERGVIAIFPMLQQRDSCQVRILEIYADQSAYRHHLTTPHFRAYKEGTLHMVKSLDLVDMHPLNPGGMEAVFAKLKH